MLTELQIKKLTKLFNAYDVDGNGVMEVSDSQTIINKIATLRGWEKGSAEYELVESTYMSVWEDSEIVMDANGDGQISLEESLDYYEQIFGTMSHDIFLKEASSILNFFDVNGNGLLGLDEYKNLLQVYDIPLDQAEEAFARLDQNGDGEISVKELQDALHDFYTSSDPDAPGNWLIGRVE